MKLQSLDGGQRNRLRIISFSGFAHAGKTTSMLAAEQHLMRCGHAVKVFNFADKLKKSVSVATDVPLEWFYDEKLKVTPHPNLGGRTPRYAMQVIGTEGYVDLIHPRVWVDGVERDIQEWLDKQFLASAYARSYFNHNRSLRACALIGDLRLSDEFAWLKEQGGYSIWVDRPSVVPDLTHRSESFMQQIRDKVDATVYNTETTEVLWSRVQNCLDFLFTIDQAQQRT